MERIIKVLAEISWYYEATIKTAVFTVIAYWLFLNFAK